MPNAKAIVGSLIYTLVVLFSAAAYAEESDCSYIFWGVDEFELFGLTKNELSQQFKNKLTFDWANSRAYVGGSRRSSRQFILTIKDQRVSEVQRVKRDPAGCNLEGPLFTSKEAALRFTIEGLSGLNPLRPEEIKKLATAKRDLIEIERAKTRKDH